jgi:lysophospholipase L1-like esterase
VKAKQLLLGLGTLVVALALPEIALRLFGFHFEPGIEFGFPRPQAMAKFAPDERLFWKLRTGDASVAEKWSGNSMGFPGPEVVLPKPQGMERILFLGDSCTFLGYPEFTMKDLRGAPEEKGKSFDSVILAIPGYSSHQGRVAAEMYGQNLEADVVVVYFGWNDHWKAYGSIDSEKVVHVSHSLPSRFFARASRDMRLLQAMNWLRQRMTGADQPIGRLRVPPEEYAANLTAIDALFEQHGTQVIFVTAPTSHYALGVPPYLLLLHFVDDAEGAMKLHRAYNEIVRETARRTGAILLDLEAEAEARDDLATLFIADGIHFTEAGNAWVGGRVAQCIEKNVKPH